MLDTLTRENLRDFDARYSNTFGWLHQEGGVKRLCQLLHVEDEVIYFKFGGRPNFHARVDSGVTFEFIPVDRGWFNTVDHGPLLLQRVPARQWKRGISVNNTQVQNQYMEHVAVNYKLLSSVFEGPTVDVGSKIGNEAVALSKHFCLTEGGSLYFYSFCIGQCIKNKIALYNSLVKQELQDLITRKTYPLEIVNG